MSVVTRRPPTAVRVTTTATTGTGARSTRARVPWGTVVPLAVALALANSFWMVVLRGAVGAVERTQQPFLSWWRDSLLTLPFATLAVLVAVQVARRLLGRTRGRFGFLISWLLVVAFGTVAGLMQVALSAVYDYVLQTRENVMMTTGNGGMCSGPDCLERMQHATMALQLRALGFGAGVILVTNLVVTIWVIAIRGVGSISWGAGVTPVGGSSGSPRGSPRTGPVSHPTSGCCSRWPSSAPASSTRPCSRSTSPSGRRRACSSSSSASPKGPWHRCCCWGPGDPTGRPSSC